MKILLSLLGGLAVLGALLLGGRRYRCTCPAVAALEEARTHLVTYIPPGSMLSERAATARCVGSEPALALTNLGQLGFELESSGTRLPDQFWQSLLAAAQLLNHPDWLEVIQARLWTANLP